MQQNNPTTDHGEEDHDLIPDPLQKSSDSKPDQPLARSAKHDERDFGQMAKRPVDATPEKLKKLETFDRILGKKLEEKKTLEKTKKSDWGEPPQKQALEKPTKTDWSPIDLSHGTQHIGGGRQSFIIHEKQDLKKSLGTILNAGQREEVAKRFYKAKEHGLTRGKIKREVGKMLKEGKLNKFEARRILRGSNANKSSGPF